MPQIDMDSMIPSNIQPLLVDTENQITSTKPAGLLKCTCEWTYQVCSSTFCVAQPHVILYCTYISPQLRLHSVNTYIHCIYIMILEVNLFAFTYRLFHEDFSSIIGVLHDIKPFFIYTCIH